MARLEWGESGVTVEAPAAILAAIDVSLREFFSPFKQRCAAKDATQERLISLPKPEVLAGTPGERIDVGGQWVIPGLSDLHTHSFGNQAPGGAVDGGGTASVAQRVVRAGVTSFLDLFSGETYILQLPDRQRDGGVEGAEIFAAGPCFTATDGHCSEYGIPSWWIDSPEDARRQLAESAPKRPDVEADDRSSNVGGTRSRGE